MIRLLQYTITGISLGVIYALIAMGFVIILKCSKAFNIAQGHIVMIGGYLGFTFIVMCGMPLWAALLAAIGTAAVMGLLIERFTLRPLVGQPVLAVVMMTIALGFCVLEGLSILIWGGQYKAYTGALPPISLVISGITVSSATLFTLILAVIIVTGLMLFFRYAKIGLAMRATAEDEQVAQCAGIRVTTVYAISWVIACVTGVVAGFLVGAESGVQTQMANLGLKAFAVILLGGLDSIGGAILAGIIVGLAETMAAGYLDPLTTTGGLATIFPFIIIIIVLVIRPHGIFGTKHIERI